MLQQVQTHKQTNTNKPLSLSYRWHRRSGITEISYLHTLFQLHIHHTFKVFKAVVHHIVKPRGGGFPSGWTVGKYLLGASSHFVLGRCVPLPLSTTIRHMASPTWPRGLVRHECLDCWCRRYKALAARWPTKQDGGSLWLCGENQQYGCCRHRGWSIGGRSRLWLEVGGRSRPWQNEGGLSRLWPSEGGRRRGLNGPVHRRHRLWLFNK